MRIKFRRLLRERGLDGRVRIGRTDEVMTSTVLSALYGTQVDVLRVRDRVVDLSKPGRAEPMAAGDRAFYTAATELQPTDGIVASRIAASVFPITITISRM